MQHVHMWRGSQPAAVQPLPLPHSAASAGVDGTIAPRIQLASVAAAEDASLATWVAIVVAIVTCRYSLKARG